MELKLSVFLIVCPMVFLAGFIDSIGGGGGLISLPAYLFAGLPPHMAIATNKMSSMCGTAVATVRLLRHNRVHIPLAACAVAFAMLGSSVGARLSLVMDDKVILYLMLVVLPICAFFVLSRRFFVDREQDADITARTYAIVLLSALLVGVYDGLYGPGTGTFLIIAFTVFARMTVGTANTYAKVINLVTNITSFTVFLLNGQVLLPLGLTAAAFNMAGNYVGSGLAIRKGSALVRLCILTVLVLLLVKLVFFRDM